MVLSGKKGDAYGFLNRKAKLTERRYSLPNGRFPKICHCFYVFAWPCFRGINFPHKQNNQVAASLKKDGRSIPRIVEEVKEQTKKPLITLGQL